LTVVGILIYAKTVFIRKITKDTKEPDKKFPNFVLFVSFVVKLLLIQ